MSNPRYKKDTKTGRFITGDEPTMADKPICVRLPVDVEQVLRSMPNRSEFLRGVITNAVRKKIQPNQTVGEV